MCNATRLITGTLCVAFPFDWSCYFLLLLLPKRSGLNIELHASGQVDLEVSVMLATVFV